MKSGPPLAGTAQAGLTLVELMVSIALGLFVVMAAIALLLSAKSGYVTQDDTARIEETGRYAIESIARAVRQAAYENWDVAEAPIVTAGSVSANLAGLDASSLKATLPGIDSPDTQSVNGSDVLAVRFFGAGKGEGGDGTIINCAGFGIPAAASQESADAGRGWSVFYVDKDASGEPELYCKYAGDKWTAQAIARGVESFQVLYGLDTDGDAVPDRLLTASAINALDDALVLEGADAEAKAGDRNRKTNWKRVVLVKVALLVRGERGAGFVPSNGEYHLFGKEYTDQYGASDAGVYISEAKLPKTSRNRIRKVFAATIQLRNQSAGSGS